MAGLGLINRRRAIASSPTAGIDKIKFADPAVEAIVLANWDTDGNGYFTKSEAEAVTDLGMVFNSNAEITSFEELENFSGLTYITSKLAVNQGAFENCTALTKVSIPKSVKTIGDFSFRGCTSLTSIGDTSNIEMIRREAFTNTKITELILPKCTSLAAIGYYAPVKKLIAPLVTDFTSVTFRLQALECLLLGEGLKNIGTYTFWQMTANLTAFICKAVTPPTLGGSNNMSFCSAIYVPDASVADYQAATNWSAYASIIKGISQLATDNPTLYAEIKNYL